MYMNFIDWMARTSRKKKKKTYSDYWNCFAYASHYCCAQHTGTHIMVVEALLIAIYLE
jgi:hypothetical protein